MEDARLAMDAIWNGLPIFLLHSGLSLLILVIGVFVYTRITPHDEIALIKSGNSAAAVSLSGAILGLALPLASSLAASVSLWDLVFWGIIALLLQLAAFRLVDFFLKDISARIEAGEIGPAILLLSFKLATAMINAAAISG
ncbi:MAG: hypothetical protein COB37_03840 [Kordiimonadales bacterium]|nr:MAG: hypothetical protein COB37_03840 [Kordiimonadales bacterium]